jgi:hypothetical protein
MNALRLQALHNPFLETCVQYLGVRGVASGSLGIHISDLDNSVCHCRNLKKSIGGFKYSMCDNNMG